MSCVPLVLPPEVDRNKKRKVGHYCVLKDSHLSLNTQVLPSPRLPTGTVVPKDKTTEGKAADGKATGVNIDCP